MVKGLKQFRRQCPDALPGAVIYAGDIETELNEAALVNFHSICDWINRNE